MDLVGVAALISTIPGAIVGCISFVLYGMISAVGIRNLVENKIDFSRPRNLIIAAVILIPPRQSRRSSPVSSVDTTEIHLSSFQV